MIRAVGARTPGRFEYIAACAGVGLVAAAVFLPTLRCGFVSWDDPQNIITNTEYRGLGADHLRWMFSTFLMGHFQPLAWLSLGLDYVVWGMRPIGYHLTNLLLHGLSAGLLTAVLARVVTPAASRVSRGWLWGAAAMATLWGVHPLRVEAVAWITQRREVLCSVFTLLTLLVHLRGGRWWWVALLAALAMMSKATAVVLPVWIVLLDLCRAGVIGRLGWTLGSLPAWRETGLGVIRAVPLWALAAACSITAIAAQRHTGAMVSVAQHPWNERIVQFAYALGFYLWKTVWPAGLCALYEMPKVSVGRWVRVDVASLAPLAILGAAVAISGVVVGWRVRRSAPAVLALALAYIAAVAPVSGLGQSGPQVAADRYTYQPGWIMVLGAGLALAWMGLRFRIGVPASRMTVVAFGVLMAALSVLCVRQQRHWRDGKALWDRVQGVDPRSGVAALNAGIMYLSSEPPELEQAEAALLAGRRLQPWNADIAATLGSVLETTGRREEAERLYREALALNPSHKPALHMLGLMLYTTGKRDEALGLFTRLKDADPGTPEAYIVLARARAAAGRGREGIRALEEGTVRLPKVADLWRERAWLLATNPDDTARDGHWAVAAAEKAMSLTRQDRVTPPLVIALVSAYAEAGRFDDAVRAIEQWRPRLDPSAGDALASLLEQMRRREPVRVPPVFP